MSILSKGIIGKTLATVGSFLLTLSGQAQAAVNPSQSGQQASGKDDITHYPVGNTHQATGPDGRQVTVDEVQQNGEMHLAAHVNSGPTTHTNVPGHADFTGKMQPGKVQSQPAQIQSQPAQLQTKPQVIRPGGAAAAHVNSGPTTHSNIPGHADFTGKVQPGEMQQPINR